MANPYAVLMLPILLLFLAIPVLAIVCLVDIVKNEFSGNNKIIWLLVLILAPPIGIPLYFFIGRKQKIIIGKAKI